MLSKLFICLDSLIDILIPRACLLCRTPTHETHHLCRPCAKELPILSHSCQKCAQLLHSSADSSLICGQCLNDPPPYDKVFALYPYQPPLPRLIAGLKFEEQFSHARLFSSMMIQAVRRQWYPASALPDLIMPMPLHPARLRERGYNQATEVARLIAPSLKIPLDHGVTRSKATRPQTTLHANERRRNITNAFTAHRTYDGMHIAIVDDVMTTGQTVTALSRLLKRQGASKVDIWCCARCDSRS